MGMTYITERKINKAVENVLNHTNNRICLFTDAIHSSEAKTLGLYFIDFEGLKKLKDKKKTLKKITKKFHKFLVSEKLLKTILRFLGPALAKCGKFPSVLDHSTSLNEQI